MKRPLDHPRGHQNSSSVLSPHLTDSFDDDFTYITLPYALAPDAGGQTECLLRTSLKNKLISTPGYLRYPVHPPDIRYRIGRSPHGLGMFATHHLSMGDLILTERPLTITPTYLPMPELEKQLEGLTPEQRRRAILKEWEERFLRPLFSRLNPERQTAFMRLANDGSGSILGVIRTNGLDATGVVDPITGDTYAAVCKNMSRINHSCSPSADRLFDLASLTFQLRAVRDIKEGEEVFISYCDLFEPVSVRQEDLAYWGFTCICTSCTQNPSASDKRRFEIRTSVDAIGPNFRTWVFDKTLTDNHLIEISLYWMSMIEREGLEASDPYRDHLNAIVRAYVALGDTANAIKYGRLCGFWYLSQSGKDDVLQHMEDPMYLQNWPEWRTRFIDQRLAKKLMTDLR